MKFKHHNKSQDNHIAQGKNYSAPLISNPSLLHKYISIHITRQRSESTNIFPHQIFSFHNRKKSWNSKEASFRSINSIRSSSSVHKVQQDNCANETTKMLTTKYKFQEMNKLRNRCFELLSPPSKVRQNGSPLKRTVSEQIPDLTNRDSAIVINFGEKSKVSNQRNSLLPMINTNSKEGKMLFRQIFYPKGLPSNSKKSIHKFHPRILLGEQADGSPCEFYNKENSIKIEDFGVPSKADCNSFLDRIINHTEICTERNLHSINKMKLEPITKIIDKTSI
jgi:hypothetical protein